MTKILTKDEIYIDVSDLMHGKLGKEYMEYIDVDHIESIDKDEFNEWLVENHNFKLIDLRKYKNGLE